MSYNTLPLQPHNNSWIGAISARQSSSSQMVRWKVWFLFSLLEIWRQISVFFLLPTLNSSIWTTSSALLKKELQKQSGTMVRMAQGDLESPVPWAEVCVPYWQLSEHWDKGFLLHWEVPETLAGMCSPEVMPGWLACSKCCSWNAGSSYSLPSQCSAWPLCVYTRFGLTVFPRDKEDPWVCSPLLRLLGVSPVGLDRGSLEEPYGQLPSVQGELVLCWGNVLGWAAAGLFSSTWAGYVELTECCPCSSDWVEMITSDRWPLPISQGAGGVMRPQQYGCVPTGLLEVSFEVGYRQCDFCNLHGCKGQRCCKLF